MKLKIPPKNHPIITKCLEHLQTLDDSFFSEGPVQFYFPQIFRENIQILKSELEKFPFPVKLNFAHKASKSKIFPRAAKKSGINIDVASKRELDSALESGFSGNEIECTGIKNESFIKKSLDHDCLIVIDSLSELHFVNKLKSNKKPRIALRINNPFNSNGTYFRYSKFGIQKEELKDLIENDRLSDYNIEGLHIHFYEYNPENKAHMITELLSLYELFFEKKIYPTHINIGGGYRFPIVEERFKEDILHSIENIDFEDISYSDTIIGIKKGRNGRLNKMRIADKIFPLNTTTYLKEVFDFNKNNLTLIDGLSLTLFLEPGYALLENCGIIVMRVIGTKQMSKGRLGIIVDGNMYNISSQLKTWITDPIHIKKNDKSMTDCEGFIIGNLCKEDDVLIDRKIYFENEPQIGDLLVFYNTAGYVGSFEDTNAIMQPKNKNHVFLLDGKKEVVKTEEEYLESINDI